MQGGYLSCHMRSFPNADLKVAAAHHLSWSELKRQLPTTIGKWSS